MVELGEDLSDCAVKEVETSVGQEPIEGSGRFRPSNQHEVNAVDNDTLRRNN